MKIKKFLGFIALAALIVLPIKANAATGVIFNDNKACTPDPNDSDYCTVTITGFNDQGSTVSTPFTSTMTLQGVEYVSSEGSNNWSITVTGNQVVMTPSAPETSESFNIGVLRFKVISTPCSLTFECNDKTTTITPPVKNPKTGNALPYAVIGAGIVIAGAVYYVTRKNTKLYKI